jgi:ubiquinone/menaquinone biosynthesis C-methylase UbiE
MSRESRAFGVEPGYAPYRLRQARYYELGMDVAQFAAEIHQREARRVHLLDVGVGKGVTRMYTEVHPGAEHIEYHAVDNYSHGEDRVYKYDEWQHNKIDLEAGLPGLPSDHFDIVICEQVLEHLHHAPSTLGELSRVVRPGGMLMVGVPIFPHGPHLIRKHVVPFFDRLTNHKPRPHVQAFSKRSFLQLVRQQCDVAIHRTRGFRIVSGGILRPLENCRWWWRMNRQIGKIVPGLCVEIQVVAIKRSFNETPVRKAA